MQRLLVVAFSVVPSYDRHAVQLANYLKALAPRYAVDVVTVKSPDLAFVDRFMGTRMLRVPCGDGPLAEQVETFRRAVRRQLDGVDYEVVHFRCAWGGRVICERLPELGGQVIYEVTRSAAGESRGCDPELTASLSRDELYCLERAHRVVVATHSAATHLRRRGLGPKVAIVPAGVDIDLFDWEASPAAEPPRLLLTGRLGPGRGVRLLLEAVAQVVLRRRVQLWLAGPVDPGFEPSLTRAIETHGLGEQVELLGPIEHSDVPRVIAAAAVCVAPHAPDPSDRPLAPFPTKILEYLACRRALVAPRRLCVAEVVRDGQDGLLFTPGDVADLASKILQLLDDPALRERLAETGYRSVRERHPASATRRALLEVYASLAPSPPWTPTAAPAAPSTEIPASPETTTARRSFLGIVSSGHELDGADRWEETRRDRGTATKETEEEPLLPDEPSGQSS